MASMASQRKLLMKLKSEANPDLLIEVNVYLLDQMSIPMYKIARVPLNNSFKQKQVLCQMKFVQLFCAALRNKSF